MSETLGTDYAATTPFMLARYAGCARARPWSAPSRQVAKCGLCCAAGARWCGAMKRWRGARTTCLRCPEASSIGLAGRRRRRVVGHNGRTDARVRRGAPRDWPPRTDRGHAFSGERHRARVAYALQPADDAGNAWAGAVHGDRAHGEPRHLFALHDPHPQRGAPGESQRPHRHNAAAIVLALREAKCASTIGGKTFPWTQYVTLLTPAGAEHDHRNATEVKGAVRDEDIALALIVQDGGLYYYGRTMGFAFA